MKASDKSTKPTSFVERHNATSSNLYKLEEDMTSVVSYPSRANQWGDCKYRGNCDGRLFKNLVLRYKAKRVVDPMVGSGTTRDVVNDLNVRTGAAIRFWGGDLHTGFNLLLQNPPKNADFVWIHPPYWNIIRYSDNLADLSTIDDYPTFRLALETCLARCHESLVSGGRLAVLVGDVRRRGTYTPIIRDVLNMEPRLGELRSVIIKAQHHCHSDSKIYAAMPDVPIQHEYCAVFQKL
jgi:hypothetical protein